MQRCGPGFQPRAVPTGAGSASLSAATLQRRHGKGARGRRPKSGNANWSGATAGHGAAGGTVTAVIGGTASGPPAALRAGAATFAEQRARVRDPCADVLVALAPFRPTGALRDARQIGMLRVNGDGPIIAFQSLIELAQIGGVEPSPARDHRQRHAAEAVAAPIQKLAVKRDNRRRVEQFRFAQLVL